MEIREMTDKEIIETLNKLKSYFDSPFFENRQSIINALEVVIGSIENKEDSEKLNKNPFDRVKNEKKYYFIDGLDNIYQWTEKEDKYDKVYYEYHNYFNDEEFAKQVMLHQLLYRKLLKFKLEREAADKSFGYCFFVNFDDTEMLYIDETFISNRNCNGVYFNERSTAELALKEVVKPFLEEYPDFIWHM